MISLDAWGQRENETPPVEPEQMKEIAIKLIFEYSSFDGHPSEWDWKKILKTEVLVDEWEDLDA
tara:strand:+ start:528 stop:719 length:192 start_codon:yes stop_codon:yes gene_type:complete